MAETKTVGQKLKDKLLCNDKNGWEEATETEKKAIIKFCDGYIKFLNTCKTEREVVKEAISLAEKKGFKPLDKFKTLKAGDKVYFINRDKNIFLAVIGVNPIADGFSVVGAHIDSPRLDLKPNPLYEDTSLAYLKTHYYGGIKKYQWVTIPLAIHGVIVKASGEKVEINIGEKEDEKMVGCMSPGDWAALRSHLRDGRAYQVERRLLRREFLSNTRIQNNKRVPYTVLLPLRRRVYRESLEYGYPPVQSHVHKTGAMYLLSYDLR